MAQQELQGAYCYFNLRKFCTRTISHHKSEVCCVAGKEQEVAVKLVNTYFEDFLG